MTEEPKKMMELPPIGETRIVPDPETGRPNVAHGGLVPKPRTSRDDDAPCGD